MIHRSPRLVIYLPTAVALKLVRHRTLFSPRKWHPLLLTALMTIPKAM